MNFSLPTFLYLIYPFYPIVRIFSSIYSFHSSSHSSFSKYSTFPPYSLHKDVCNTGNYSQASIDNDCMYVHICTILGRHFNIQVDKAWRGHLRKCRVKNGMRAKEGRYTHVGVSSGRLNHILIDSLRRDLQTVFTL